MESRRFGETGMSVPVIGMGTWQTFDVSGADADARRDVTDAAFDTGATFFDSSPMYGRAEEVTGLLTEQMKLNDQLFLATKVRIEGEQPGIEQMKLRPLAGTSTSAEAASLGLATIFVPFGKVTSCTSAPSLISLTV